MGRIRVLLAEDHRAVAEELRAVLELECDVIGVVVDGVSLIESVARLKPDVVVADISMPLLDGLAAAERIRQGDPSGRIVFVTVNADQDVVERAFRIGALGYVLKLTAGDDLLPAIRAAMRDERYVSPRLARGATGQDIRKQATP